MKSLFYVRATHVDNENCRGIFTTTLQRCGEGLLDPLSVAIIYEERYDPIFLKVYVKELNQEFTYQVNELKCRPDHENLYNLKFPDTPELECSLKKFKEVNIMIRTCWCPTDCFKKCPIKMKLEKCPLCLAKLKPDEAVWRAECGGCTFNKACMNEAVTKF